MTVSLDAHARIDVAGGDDVRPVTMAAQDRAEPLANPARLGGCREEGVAMSQTTRVLIASGTSALLLVSSVASAALAAEPEASAESTGQRVEVPELGIALTWPEGWRLELEPPMRMEGEPGGDPPDAPFTLLGPDEVGWGSVVFGRPMTEGSNFECSVDLYEAPSLTLEAIVDLHTGLESPGEDLRYTATEVEWHEDVPAGEAVTITCLLYTSDAADDSVLV